jgi:hypothetical protein
MSSALLEGLEQPEWDKYIANQCRGSPNVSRASPIGRGGRPLLLFVDATHTHEVIAFVPAMVFNYLSNRTSILVLPPI